MYESISHENDCKTMRKSKKEQKHIYQFQEMWETIVQDARDDHGKE